MTVVYFNNNIRWGLPPAFFFICDNVEECFSQKASNKASALFSNIDHFNFHSLHAPPIAGDAVTHGVCDLPFKSIDCCFTFLII